MLNQPTKNPVLVEAGRRGAEARWGRGRILRLDDLSQPQRDVIVALVEAARAANRTVEKTAAGSNSDGQPAGRDAAANSG